MSVDETKLLVTGVGQITVGDMLEMTKTCSTVVIRAEVKGIVGSGEEEEAISLAGSRIFLTKKMIDGESWVESAFIVTQVVTSVGRLSAGDKIKITRSGDLSQAVYPVEKVLWPNTSDEEVIVDRRRNLYFRTRGMLAGQSWVRSVAILATRKGPLNVPETLEGHKVTLEGGCFSCLFRTHDDHSLLKCQHPYWETHETTNRPTSGVFVMPDCPLLKGPTLVEITLPGHVQERQ